MSSLDDFNEITQRDKPLGPLTWLKVGGAADYFIEPRSPDELARVVSCCHENGIPVHVFGGGSNLLVRDAGVSGVVVRITGEPFSEIEVDGTTVHSGAGALLSRLIDQTVRSGLAGIETLAGIPGTVGGALRGNAGGRSGDIGQSVHSVTVMTARGETFTRTEDELSFAYRFSSINELVILRATFHLHGDDVEQITRRMRKLWIMKKATQPLTFQSAGCIFKNPRGRSTGALIEQAGLRGKRIGGAEFSDRHGNFIVTHDGATADDVLRLIDVAQTTVSSRMGVDLELEIKIW